MSASFRAFRGAARVELAFLGRSRAFVASTVLLALSLLALVSLFALTGSDAPLAVVDEDASDYSRRFADALAQVPHAFSLRSMSAGGAHEALGRGKLVGAITLPRGFEASIRRGDTVPLDVEVDNLDEDLLFDLQRALPSAILAFGRGVGLPGLRVALDEHDLLPRDTPFLRYLAAATLALVAFVVGAALAALAVAREWEKKTLKLWRLSPARVSALLGGKLAAVAIVAALAVLGAALLVIFAYGAMPRSFLGSLSALVLTVLFSTALGAFIGALFRRTLAVVPFVFGLGMPLYIDCGALEPTRFDGVTIWVVAHLSPLYYAVGAIESAFFGVRVTTEPIFVDVMVLMALTVVAFAGAAWLLARAGARSRGWR
jgi:ABC-2 type transport system permease protein